VIVAPLLILWLTGSTAGWNRRRAVEAFLLLVVLCLVGEAVFGPLLPIADRHYPLQFLCFPILVWAAFRFGPRETATAAVVLAGIAIWGTLHGYGTFTRWPPSESLLLLQSFLGVLTVMALGLAAAVLEQKRWQRAQADEALRAGEVALAEAQALARVGSWSRDVSRDSVACSEEFFRICGLPLGRALDSATFLATAHPQDRGRLAEALERAGVAGEAFAFDHRVRRPDGGECWVHSRGQVVWDGDGRPLRVLGTTQDITERRGAETARSQFIANAAHELRTPLTAIVGLAEIVGGFGRNLTVEQLEDYCQLIRHQGDRVKRLITGLLDLSRMEQGLLPLELRPVALASVARRATDAVPLPDGRCIRVEVDDSLYARADASRLEAVLVNLLRNASLYGGPQVTLEAFASGDGVLLAVSDDGDGVPEDLVPHLFQPFMRGKTATQVEGSGLGLAIARGTVEAMGGSLGHEPVQPRGSRFVIRLARSVEGEAR
jgi:PAS domain S-box-containing protein